MCAYARTWADGGQGVIVVVPRLIAGLLAGRSIPPLGQDVWSETAIVVPGLFSQARLRDVLTGEAVEARELGGGGYHLPVAEILSGFPVAVLATEGGVGQGRE